MSMAGKTLALGAAVLVVAGGTYAWKPHTQPAIAQGVSPSAVASQTRRVMALGRIEPASEVVKLAAPAGQDTGRIGEIFVDEGQWVEKGAVIAILDTRPRLLAALEQADATLALRRAALAKTVADLDNQAKTLTAAMEQQESQRDRAKWEFERLQQLQKSGIYRDTALIDKRLALEGTEQALVSARLMLERNHRRDPAGLRLDEASAKAEVAAAEAAQLKARADLAFSEIRSPIAGRMLRRMGRAGEQISQDGLAEIADTRVMFVRAEIFESDLRRVAIGSQVTVTSRALGEPVQGAVTRIGLKVNRQTMIGEDPAATLDARVIEVMIRLDEKGSAATAGLSGLQVRASFEPGAGS
jgi:HlyD family secretion protein